MLRTVAILLFTSPSADPKESLERFLYKNKRFSRWRISFSLASTCLQESQTSSSMTYKTVMASHHWPSILSKRSELPKEECFIGGVPRHLHASFPHLALRKESPKTRATWSSEEWRVQEMKDDDWIKSTSATAQDSPIPISSTIRKRRSWSTKLRVDLARSEIKRANQVKARALPTFLGSRILSRKLMFCDKVITIKLMCCANRLHHLHLSPYSSIEGRRTSLSTRTRSLG